MANCIISLGAQVRIFSKSFFSILFSLITCLSFIAVVTSCNVRHQNISPILVTVNQAQDRMEHAFTPFPDHTIQAGPQADNPANGVTAQLNLPGDIRNEPLPAYVIEQGGDDTCEKNKQEQRIAGYERVQQLTVGGGPARDFRMPEQDGSGSSWIAHLFPLAPTEGSGRITAITVTYHPDYTGADTSVKICAAIGKKDPFTQPGLSYPVVRNDDYSYTWTTNPYNKQPWSWHDISTMSIGVVMGTDGSAETKPPLPHELYATITYTNLFLGSDAEKNLYDLGLRFNLAGASRITNFTYARLILPTNEFNLAENHRLRLRLTGQNVADASDFSSERPSQKQPITANYVDWAIDRDDLPGDMNGIHGTQAILTSPNIAPIINETARGAAWAMHSSSSRNIALTIACAGTETAPHNLICLADFEAGLLYNPLTLELYKTVYDCFIAREAVARVTDTTALINCISLLSLDFYVEYKAAGTYRWRATSRITGSMPGQPIEVTLRDLSPATEYLYRVVYRETGKKPFSRGMAHSFRTQRAEGDEFTFTIESDTHVRYSEKVLAWTQSAEQLQMQDLSWDTIEHDNADFHINLGDWFEGRAGHCVTEATAVYDYIKTKAYQGTRCWPTYFALGNHEGENPTQDKYHLNARSARMKVVPNPDASVSAFYKNPNPYESYYAWDWGDALFIVLDPYSYCTDDPDKDPWNWTLGKTQYDWLYDTLSSSQKKWKFVFLHHLTGGKREVRNYGRGGIEYAKFKVKQNATYEWGGEDEQGNNRWSEKRPGWEHGAIHDMLESRGVTAVFHGHDHGFAHQVLDDIHYIECPTISGIGMFQLLYDPGFLKAADYENGVSMGNNGYIRVTVNPKKVFLEYVGTIRDADEEMQGYKNGTIRYAATLESKGN